MPRPGTLEICRKHLFDDLNDIPEAYRDRVSRIRVGFTFWYEFPTKTRTEVRDHIVSIYGVANKTAYEDLQIVDILLGNIKNPSKAWMRYRVNAIFEEALVEARKEKNAASRANAITAVGDKMGKYNQLDKPDAEPLPFDEIVPQNFDPTDDPSPMGIKKDPKIREKKNKMLEKYNAEIEIIDVPYEEIIKNDSDEEENIL